MSGRKDETRSRIGGCARGRVCLGCPFFRYFRGNTFGFFLHLRVPQAHASTSSSRRGYDRETAFVFRFRRVLITLLEASRLTLIFKAGVSLTQIENGEPFSGVRACVCCQTRRRSYRISIALR